MKTTGPPAAPRLGRAALGVVVVALGALAVARALSGPRAVPAAPAVASAAASSSTEAPPPPGLRCTEVSPEPFVIGEAPRAPAQSPLPDGSVAAAPGDPAEDPPEEELAPFAVEVGHGTTFDGGFAAGALRDAEGGTVAMVATVGFDGRGGKLVRLGRSRGDLDPPVVAGLGGSVLAAMLEPNAGGRAIKVAKITGDEVTWGVELKEGRDESLAVDLAVSGARAVVVWDDLSPDEKRSNVMLASFDTATMRSVTRARPASASGEDADSPRLIARPGGYWLAYLVSGEVDRKKRKGTAKDDDEEDTAMPGEPIPPRWVSLAPLDETGAAVSAARAVTPKDGHALAFDLELGDEGGALLTWRDDDTPSGSVGGRLSVTLVRLSGGSDPRVLADEGGGTGVPDLLPGWLAVSAASGRTRIAPMNGKGELDGELGTDPAIGNGELLAATRDAILVARPAGKAMRLGVVRCTKGPGGAPPPGPASAQAPAASGRAPASAQAPGSAPSLPASTEAPGSAPSLPASAPAPPGSAPP